MAISTTAVLDRPRAADHHRTDLIWERLQEQALQAFERGKAAEARSHWVRALEIAERYFERGDPRLAASLSNHAFALKRQNHLHQANIYFQQALDAWDDNWAWIPWMAPSPTADMAEPAPYDRQTLDAFYALTRQGRAVTEALWREGRLPAAAGDDWSSVKPRGMNDIRRLYAAVFLMPRAR